MDSTTRAQFLTRGAKGGLALVAGGAILGLAEGTAFGAASADADIAKLAATAELLAIDFYTHAIDSKQLKGDELSYLVGARGNEQAHYAAFKGVLKSATPKGLKFKYPTGAFALAQVDRHARQGTRDGVRRRLHGRGHLAAEQRAEGCRGRDRRLRVAAPERADEHRGERDRPGARPAEGADRGKGDRSRHAVSRLSQCQASA